MRTHVWTREVSPDERPAPSITTVIETIAGYLGNQPSTTGTISTTDRPASADQPAATDAIAAVAPRTADGPATSGLSGSEELMATVTETLFADGNLQFDDDIVRANLDELLMLLIAQRRTETNGKTLIEDLTQLFDADLSPGTVYPRLHLLRDQGVLDVQELVRTKEYEIEDADAVRSRLERSLAQHLALSYAIHLTLEDL